MSREMSGAIHKISQKINGYLFPPPPQWELNIRDGWRAIRGGKITKGIGYIAKGMPGLCLFFITCLAWFVFILLATYMIHTGGRL